jgi:OHCU decarboxylase
MPDRVETGVQRLNALPPDALAGHLRACCGSKEWVTRMIALRPFASSSALMSACDEVCRMLTREDWLEAFSHHPRLGESRAQVAQDERARAWSAREQAGLATAGENVREALAAANAMYEQEYGYICIISAAGKDPEELLAVTRARLGNTPQIELRIAAEEQRKITRLRLGKLVSE